MRDPIFRDVTADATHHKISWTDKKKNLGLTLGATFVVLGGKVG